MLIVYFNVYGIVCHVFSSKGQTVNGNFHVNSAIEFFLLDNLYS